MGSEKIARFFAGWDKTFIFTCLQGHMGRTAANDPERPTAGRITVGDFCLFAGEPDRQLVRTADASILIPRDDRWAALIRQEWGRQAKEHTRYAMKREADVFDVGALARYTSALPDGFQLRLMDGPLYQQALRESWSKDLCALFSSETDYLRRGLGAAALWEGRLVSGASSYSIYRGGIEIEIDTHPDFRRRGLAAACGAQLILACLQRGLYPGWDAHDLRSAALAEKLGYRRGAPYPAYILTE